MHFGYVKNDKEYNEITKFLNQISKKLILKLQDCLSRTGIIALIYCIAFLVQDLLSAFKFANKWIELFFLSPEMIALHPVFFIRGHQYLFEILFLLKYRSKFKIALERFEQQYHDPAFREPQYFTLYFYG